ncbi:tetracycline resistance MFS efflux pump [Pontibacter saemangeumensis]|uniref:Tetracycline resistance MFS efflux pump n=2 Tax=Pontibacter saemangeumensis TaxID=1084525 RepID=A0ABP8LH26_9BACT
MLNKEFGILLLALLVVMTGYGALLPVLPFFVERLALAEGLSENSVLLHFGILTAIYPATIVFTAPFWGHVSDKVGHKPLIVIGLAGFVLMQLLTGLSTTLFMLYVARIVGSLFSSFLVLVINAYISDITAEKERSQAMAWSGTAVSVGVVVGPGISGVLAKNDLHLSWRMGHFLMDRYSVSFFALAALGMVVLIVSLLGLKWVKKSIASEPGKVKVRIFRRDRWKQLTVLLTLSLTIQLAITMFETTFSLYARGVSNYPAAFIGVGLLVCGGVMAVFQPLVVNWGNRLIPHVSAQILYGFLTAGTALMLLAVTQESALILLTIGLFALGASLAIPNLLAAVSLKGGNSPGQVLGIQSAFNGVGQIIGPLAGTGLYAVAEPAPFITGGMLLLTASLLQVKVILKTKSLLNKT